jgi:hypothetical protein
MINNIASRGVHAADIALSRRHCDKKADTTQPATDGTEAAAPKHKHDHRPPGLARAAENIGSKLFKDADADSSGGISKEELSAAISKHESRISADDLFKELDTDTDGSVGQTELTDALKKYFYAKVDVAYQPVVPPVADPANTVGDTISATAPSTATDSADTTASTPANSTFSAVA